MNTARTTSGGGSQTAAIAAGGSTPPFTGIVEEWNGTGLVTTTVTTTSD